MAEITGTNGNDTKNGGAKADLIRLLGGNDRSYGYDGNDTMVGGWGDDTLYGYDDNDRINGGGGVDVLEGGNGNDRAAGGGGDDDIGGGYGNDTLDGGSGRDTLEGSYGDDVIDGGAGRDQLDGGSGADRFALDAGDRGVGSDVRDVIYRFDAHARDRIDLRAIDANTGASGDQTFLHQQLGGGGELHCGRADPGRAAGLERQPAHGSRRPRLRLPDPAQHRRLARPRYRDPRDPVGLGPVRDLVPSLAGG
jgi:Ca2+-binding RTX toxin-like protein